MKSIIRTITLFILCGYTYLQINAQDIARHEFSIGIGGGLSTLNYTSSAGNSKNKMGGKIGLDYTYFLTKEFGLVSGIEYSQYNADIKDAAFSNILAGLTDPSDQELFDLKTGVSKYEEKQTAHYINIPLMIQYQRGYTTKFYTSIGFKIGIPISGHYESKGNFDNQGFFYESGIWTSTPEFMGFGNLPNKEVDGNLDFKIAYIASIELGVKIPLYKNRFIYAGAYFDYGINNIVDNAKQNFTNYLFTESKVNFSNNSMLSSYTNDNIKFTEKVNSISAGIKFRFGFIKL